MTIATKVCLPLLLLFFTLWITACSNDDKASTMNEAVPKEHFAKQKLDTLKKAEAVNQLVQDTAARQDRNIDEQSQ